MIIMDRSPNGGESFTTSASTGQGKRGNTNRRRSGAGSGRVSRFDVYRFTPVRTRKAGHYRADGPAGGVENAQA